MRLLRGASLDLLARESAQPAGRISAWREEFLAGGREGLKSRPAPVDDRRLAEAQRKVGELTMDLDILRALNDEMDRHPQSPRRSASASGCPHPLQWSAGWLACPVRRLMSNAAGGAPRSRSGGDQDPSVR